jgi:hypothetical protein
MQGFPPHTPGVLVMCCLGVAPKVRGITSSYGRNGSCSEIANADRTLKIVEFFQHLLKSRLQENALA